LSLNNFIVKVMWRVLGESEPYSAWEAE